MRKLKPNRKARFKAALALAGMELQDWAIENGITRQHLSAVLREDRDSNALIQKVDAFIADVNARTFAESA